MGNKTTLYDILEVSAGASEAAIRTAFERLKASYLADQLDSKGMDRNAYFQLVKEAYATLSDASLRRAYDQKLQEPAAPVMALRRSSSTSDRTEGASSGALMWGALLLVLVLAGWGLHSYKTARDAERAMQLEAQRIEAERLAAEAAATERAQALEAERLQREQARDAAALERQRAREFETARRDADRVSQRLESARKMLGWRNAASVSRNVRNCETKCSANAKPMRPGDVWSVRKRWSGNWSRRIVEALGVSVIEPCMTLCSAARAEKSGSLVRSIRMTSCLR